MSLVGTRPILQDELRQYELHHRARIAIKPGITGMWQVSGRSDITDFEEVVRLDTEYISKASCEMKIMDEHMILSEGATVEFKHDLIDNNQKDLEWWTAKHNWYSNREVLDHQMTLENAMDIMIKRKLKAIYFRYLSMMEFR